MNYPENNWIDPRIEIKESPIHGRGMYAGSDIRKGDLLIVWRECYTNKEGALEAIRHGKGIMQWDDDVFSVETDLHSDDYLINHSCDPNSWIKNAHSLEAMVDIKAGEEITVDYAIFESDEGSIFPWTCCCGSTICRETITGKDWRRSELQDRYRGHFSPLLNKRIGRISL